MKKEESRISNFLLLFLCLFLLFFNWNTFFNLLKAKREEKYFREIIENLTQKKEKLLSELEKTKSATFWEERIRKQGLGKPGEQRIIIQFPENFLERKMTIEEREGIFEKFLKLFRKER